MVETEDSSEPDKHAGYAVMKDSCVIGQTQLETWRLLHVPRMA